jgi:hypothetical protein
MSYLKLFFLLQYIPVHPVETLDGDSDLRETCFVRSNRLFRSFFVMYYEQETADMITTIFLPWHARIFRNLYVVYGGRHYF